MNDPEEPPASVELYLLRHADAGDPAAWTGDDADRPLSKKGKRQARRLAELLCDIRWRPDVMVTSPKLRARQTADALAQEVKRKPIEDDRLGGGLDLAALGGLLAEHPGAMRIALVGHDPDFSAIASSLTGAALEVRKGALVRIDLPTRGAMPGAGVLRWLIPPKVVPR
ncbi:MAG TPA: histidine phosphatase family protein [Candidatus Limnocylindria bacterium]|nr:histidine phosphatase family protein [Candidatus Limnocylindria bacterium]